MKRSRPFLLNFAGINAFEYPAWIKMPEGNGHMTGFWDGKKINGPSEIPREMLDRMEREYPRIAGAALG